MQNADRQNSVSITELMRAMKSEDVDLILYAVHELHQKDHYQMIGNLEYCIRKLTTHPDEMGETDFQATQLLQSLIHFLKISKPKSL